MDCLPTLLLTVVLAQGSPEGQAPPVFVWTDASGVEHYTNDRSTVPKGVRPRTTTGAELQEMSSEPLPRRQPQTRTKETAPAAAETPSKPVGPVRVFLSKVEGELTETDRQYIERCIAAASASPRLLTWGGLTESVGVEIHPRSAMRATTFDPFGLALGTDTIRLRAPRDTQQWGRPLPYDTTMLHELGHILENQHAGQERPRWFAEGFANYVADFSGYASREDVAWWTIRKGGQAPLELAFSEAPIHLAYALATLAVRYLIELVGESSIRTLFELRKRGTRFDRAFALATGFDVSEFQRRFVQHLRPSYFDRAE